MASRLSIVLARVISYALFVAFGTTLHEVSIFNVVSVAILLSWCGGLEWRSLRAEEAELERQKAQLARLRHTGPLLKLWGDSEDAGGAPLTGARADLVRGELGTGPGPRRAAAGGCSEQDRGPAHA